MDVRRNHRRLALFVAAGLSVSLTCACSQTSSGESSSGESGSTASSFTGADLQSQYESVITQVLPSVVEIRTDSGLGSGVVFDTAGHIVTNAHVVGDARTFQVKLPNQAAPVKGTLVGAFPEGDLAVIKVGSQAGLRPARFGNSDQVRLGEIVLAMGNPLGLSSSVTNGIVSATGRTLTEPQTEDSPGATLPDSIQTSAAINPGNSGGALVDLKAQVIGIPTLAATNQQGGGAAPGIGFAIPANTVRSIAGQLVKTGKVTDSGRAALGIEASTMTDASGNAAGVGVVSVAPGGPAAKAGIKAGDIIVEIGGQPVPDLQSLSSALAELDVGQEVTVTIRRDGATRDIPVTLGELQSG
jgi:S1-C subfamily serine protease